MAEALTVEQIQVPHGFFTRRGGVSTGPYASLNCSLSGTDDRASVLENRARVARSVGVDPAGAPWAPGAGDKADAMVTDRAGLALGIVTADCAPVLFAAADGRVVGAAHAGWRGAVAGVLEATVEAMAALGAVVGEITAAIGPCIAQPSYEVGPDLRDAVLARSPDGGRFFAPGVRADRWQFDLSGYCASRLRATGVGQVVVTGHDTMAEEDRFFSHRRRTLAQGGPIGHQISVVRVRP